MSKILTLLACVMLSGCALKLNLTPAEKAAMDQEIASSPIKGLTTLQDAPAEVASQCRPRCLIASEDAYRVLVKYFVDQVDRAYLAGRSDAERGVPLYDQRQR